MYHAINENAYQYWRFGENELEWCQIDFVFTVSK